MTLAILTVGLSGSGKSTLLKSIAKAHDLVYISPDDIVEARCGNPHDQSFRSEAGVQADWHTMMSCAMGMPVILDSTFVDTQKRRSKIEFLRRSLRVPRIIGIFFDVPLPVALERNQQRPFVVPAPIVRRQHEQLMACLPSEADGFDIVYRSEEIEQLLRVELRCRGKD